VSTNERPASSVKSATVPAAIRSQEAATTAAATSSTATVWISTPGKRLGPTSGSAAAARNSAVPP